jgi:hypothetical protein
MLSMPWALLFRVKTGELMLVKPDGDAVAKSVGPDDPLVKLVVPKLKLQTPQR